MIKNMDNIFKAEMNKSLGRWKDVLNNLALHYVALMPDKWKERAVEDFEKDFVQSKFIVQGFIDGIGNDYRAADLWLLSFAKISDLE